MGITESIDRVGKLGLFPIFYFSMAIIFIVYLNQSISPNTYKVSIEKQN